MQNNTLGDGQSMVKEVSLMEIGHKTGHMADAEYQVWKHWFPPFYLWLFIWSSVHAVAHVTIIMACIHAALFHDKRSFC